MGPLKNSKSRDSLGSSGYSSDSQTYLDTVSQNIVPLALGSLNIDSKDVRNDTEAMLGSCEYANGITDITPISPKKCYPETPIQIEKMALSAIREIDVSQLKPLSLCELPSDQLISDMFKEICRSNNLASPFAFGRNYYELNRYSDVVPHDHCRCTVNNGVYINASPLVFSGRTYILTQAPKDSTLFHFRELLRQYNVDTIVTLSMPYEKKVEKGLNYWTSVMKEGTEKTIASKGEQSVVERDLLINNKSVRQFHYQNWPDQGTPDLELFSQLILLAKFSNNPLLVHCSAGIGRSGVFAISDALIREKPSLESVPLQERVMQARGCRPGLIQTWTQLKFVMEAVLFNLRKDLQGS